MSQKRIKNKSKFCTSCEKETPKQLLITIPFEHRELTKEEELQRKEAHNKDSELDQFQRQDILRNLRIKTKVRLCPDCVKTRIRTLDKKDKNSDTRKLTPASMLHPAFLKVVSKIPKRPIVERGVV